MYANSQQEDSNSLSVLAPGSPTRLATRVRLAPLETPDRRRTNSAHPHPQTHSVYPRARTLAHPGPYNPARIQSRITNSARHLRIQLQPGISLYDGLVKPLQELGVASASTTILGGMFDSLSYCTAPPDPTGRAIIAYTKPIETRNAWMVFGNATVGKGAKGEPLVHCHATFRAGTGDTLGGHIVPHSSVVGNRPISVLVTSIDGFELRLAFDPETNIPLIQPRDLAGGDEIHE